MKQILSAIFFCLLFNFASAKNSFSSNNTTGPLSQAKLTSSIDMLDTVVFDISQSTMAGNQVSFPVYIITDDTINALDFSLMFDETNFSLDTIINLTAYLQPVYNQTMGTLYFTSYSLQDIEHNISLVSIRLNMLGHFLCSDDLNSVLAYLNGDACSVKVIECLSDKIAEVENADDQASIYPNPATGTLNIKPNSNSTVELLELNGSRLLFHANADANQNVQINTSAFSPGVYLVKVFNDSFVSVKKVVIN